MILTNLTVELRKLLTARGSLVAVVTCVLLLTLVSGAIPVIGLLQGGPASELATSMVVAGLPLTIVGAIVGILIMTMDWQHRDVSSIFIVAPSRGRLFIVKVLASLIAGAALSLLVVIVSIGSLLVVTAGGSGIDGQPLIGAAGMVLSLGVISTLSGSAIASVLLSLPLALIFVFVQTLIIDPALYFAGSWGVYFQGSAAASALIGDGAVLPGVSSAAVWILLPFVLGAWRQRGRDVG